MREFRSLMIDQKDTIILTYRIGLSTAHNTLLPRCTGVVMIYTIVLTRYFVQHVFNNTEEVWLQVMNVTRYAVLEHC